MNAYLKFIMAGMLAAALLVGGCAELNPSAGPRTVSEPPARQEPLRQREISDPTRFQTGNVGQSALDSAIELSQKFAALSENMVRMQEEKERLAVENKQLKERIATLEPEAEQARKELAEANDLLVEMRIELNNWKSDILGFREEIREADKTQLEALLKILRVLGGEQPSGAGSSAAHP